MRFKASPYTSMEGKASMANIRLDTFRSKKKVNAASKIFGDVELKLPDARDNEMQVTGRQIWLAISPAAREQS